MDKDTAKSLLSLSKSLDGTIVKMFGEVEKISDPAIKLQFRKSVGDLMGYIAATLYSRLKIYIQS